MTDNSKTLVTRAALERVLARAAELQVASGDDTEPADTLTEAQILELGKEVGLSPEYLRQALAEERARIEPLAVGNPAFYSDLLGAWHVAAQRVVRGSPARILATLDRWMDREEWLRIVRQRVDRRVWEPKRGIVGAVRRLFAGRGSGLYRANDITATVVPVDEESSLVRLEADFSGLRSATATQAVVGTGVGATAGVVLIALNVMVPVAVAPAIVLPLVSYATFRRTQRQALARAHLTLEQVLDRLERGDGQPPSLLRMIEAALPPSR